MGPIDWNRRLTPSKLGKAQPVQQLGSLEAVLAELPDGGIVVMRVRADFDDVPELLQSAGRRPDALRVITAAESSYDEVMLRLPTDTPIGIAPGAYDLSLSQEYRRAYEQLRRFKKVIWG